MRSAGGLSEEVLEDIEGDGLALVGEVLDVEHEPLPGPEANLHQLPVDAGLVHGEERVHELVVHVPRPLPSDQKRQSHV